jgi:hypothetical protein
VSNAHPVLRMKSLICHRWPTSPWAPSTCQTKAAPVPSASSADQSKPQNLCRVGVDDVIVHSSNLNLRWPIIYRLV